MSEPASAEKLIALAIDTVSASIGILDREGRILCTNRAWKERGGGQAPFGAGFEVGGFYAEQCRSLRPDSGTSGAVSRAVREVIDGQRDRACIESEFFEDEDHKLLMTRIQKLRGSNDGYLIVEHVESDRARRTGTPEPVADAIVDGFYESDAEGQLTYANPALSEMLRIPRPDMIGCRFDDFTDGEEACPLDGWIHDRPSDDGEGRCFELRLTRGDGTTATVEASCAPVRDRAGRTLGFRGVIREATDGAAIEEELRRYGVAVEEARKNAERQASELATQAEELVTARNQALDAVRVKAEFVANVSHEIRTPMNGMIGMTDLMLCTAVTDEQREYLVAIRSSANALLTLINDMLDFSKIETGRLELEAIPFSVRDSLPETLKPLALRAHAKGIELVYEVAHDLRDALIGDPSRLRQVIVNLVDNAIKFTDRGQIVVRAILDSEADETTTVRFEVGDTGIGIAPGKQQVIFDSFAQGDGTATRRYGGTGLGLSISSQLVKLMGGRIWVDSEPGRGSTFSFTARFPTGPLPARPVASAAPELTGQRVLIADDNAANRNTMVDILARLGLQTETCEDGQTALAALRHARAQSTPFTFALLDVEMPGIDGFELAQEIRSDPELETRVILMTLAGQRGDAARSRDLGVAAYLTKPFAVADLTESLRAALGNTDPELAPPLITRHSLRENRNQQNILVAEGNPSYQSLARALLERQGHSVTVADNGGDALERMEQDRFHLVLIDVETPAVDGIQLVKIIRDRERGTRHRVPIVALTSYVTQEDRDRFINAGMDGYLTKPFCASEVMVVLSQLANGIAAPEVTPAPVPGADREEDAVPAPRLPAGKVIDEERLLEIAGGDTGLLGEIVRMFVDDKKTILDGVSTAVDRNDAGALEVTAHKLKGTFGTLAADGAVQAALRLETIGRGGDLSEAPQALEELLAEARRVESALMRLTETVPHGDPHASSDLRG